MNRNIQERPSDSITPILTEHCVVLVHFIGEGPGVRGPSTQNLTPIESALIIVNHQYEVPCSTVRAGDSWTKGNYFGRIGIILDPIVRGNITHATPIDGGTLSPSVLGGRRTGTNGLNSDAAIAYSIQSRPFNQHNEICVMDYRVIGLFWEVTNNDELMAPPAYRYSRNAGSAFYSHSVLDFANDLPDLPIYIWRDNRFIQTSLQNGRWHTATPVSLERVYQ
jgi:hypothetical protein